jgi:hypothetical protein
VPLRLAALLLAFTAAFAGCGSSSDGDAGPGAAIIDGDTVAVGAAPQPTGDVGAVRDAMEVVAGAPAAANAAACDAERQTLELAVEAYTLLNGAAPGSLDELVEAQIVREPSTLYDVTAGTVVPNTDGPCA